MSECNLDHTLNDVQKKYQFQKERLPDESISYLESFFKTEPSQAKLNTVFHLLKKYDLITEDERLRRNEQLLQVLKDK